VPHFFQGRQIATRPPVIKWPGIQHGRITSMENIRPLLPCTGAGNRSRYVRLVLENSRPAGAGMTASQAPFQHHQKRHEKNKSCGGFMAARDLLRAKPSEKRMPWDAMGICCPSCPSCAFPIGAAHSRKITNEINILGCAAPVAPTAPVKKRYPRINKRLNV